MTRPIQLARFRDENSDILVGSLRDDQVLILAVAGSGQRLSDLLEAEDPVGTVERLEQAATSRPVAGLEWLPPVDEQEIWAAGVTYTRSKSARMEESETAASCYDRVYVSPRPELFLKATPHRVVGQEGPIRIRQDATWNVPEPELTLVLNSRMELVGFTVGNDVSSRDIEGDNPLYLPQAKVYDQSCALGPAIVLAGSVEGANRWPIELSIERQGSVVFTGATNVDQMARSFDELIGWLGRDMSFPGGAMLMTGTGIVPDSDFTLEPGDRVSITIGCLGTLTNTVVRG
ncbi:MAG: fumarylacetoacetate hydrolase family protein [Planctomycetales bacterium]|nr:fumarylacetoacetate hydrolase family protein [Planctomycetales bacterium]